MSPGEKTDGAFDPIGCSFVLKTKMRIKRYNVYFL